MYGLINLPIVPLRSFDSERSEMKSQLLFGEFVEVLEQSEKWLYVRNLADDYQGWADKKMISIISDNDYLITQNARSHRLSRTSSIIYNTVDNQSKLLPGGSVLYNLSGDYFKIGAESWKLINPIEISEEPLLPHQLIELAMKYVNAPYLWGGKSIFGIDCSGLVQVVFAIGGYLLPRDASQQVEAGKTVDFLSEALPGDLAFFENQEGSIIHVGILIDSSNIIHASGWVKIESIDAQGIISSSTGTYTHQLRVIKRIVI